MHRLRIAFAALGDADDRALWSGTPSSIVRELREFGVDVVTVDARSPADKAILNVIALPRVILGLRKHGLRAGLHRERGIAQHSIALARARTRTVNRKLRRCGPLDGVVQIGTDFLISHPNTVSYEDMTVAQALQWPEAFWDEVPRRVKKARLDQQSKAYRNNRAAAFTTHWAARSAIAELGCSPSKVHVLGVGANHVADATQKRDWSVPRFLFVGRDWERKNGPMTVEAFAEVRKTFPLAELHLTGHHDPVSAPGVTDHGHLKLGVPEHQQTLLDLWATSTCLVVPSRFEATGVVYVEAMYAGIPSIGTTRGGASDVIGDAGLAVDPTAADVLVSAMQTFCNPAVASEAGRRARQRSSQFSWKRVAAGLIEALDLPGGS